MDGLGTLLFFAILFFLMMRFGCGAHVMHGQDKKGDDAIHDHNENQKYIDPVCEMEVEMDQGYGKMHNGKLYRFCTKNCLNKFDEQPEKYLNTSKSN